MGEMPKLKLELPAEVRGYPDRIRSEMREQGVTQSQLEELTGITQGKISKLTNGKDAMGGSVAYAALIAAALNVRVGWLLAGEEPRRRAQRIPQLPEIAQATPEDTPHVAVRAKHD